MVRCKKTIILLLCFLSLILFDSTFVNTTVNAEDLIIEAYKTEYNKNRIIELILKHLELEIQPETNENLKISEIKN